MQRDMNEIDEDLLGGPRSEGDVEAAFRGENMNLNSCSLGRFTQAICAGHTHPVAMCAEVSRLIRVSFSELHKHYSAKEIADAMLFDGWLERTLLDDNKNIPDDLSDDRLRQAEMVKSYRANFKHTRDIAALWKEYQEHLTDTRSSKPTRLSKKHAAKRIKELILHDAEVFFALPCQAYVCVDNSLESITPYVKELVPDFKDGCDVDGVTKQLNEALECDIDGNQYDLCASQL